MKIKFLALALMAAGSVSAQAAGLDLSKYSLTGTHALDVNPGGSVSGLEGSGITYARDRGTFFYVGDEGTGVVEISKTGQTLGVMSFNWSGTASTNHDTEGLAYLGNGKLAVGEERLQDIYSFNYVKNGSVRLADNYVSISNTSVGNNGMEGIAYDARNGGSWVTVKQQSPEDILSGKLTFSSSGGSSTMSNLFNPSLLGLATFSDVATLSGVDRFVGTAFADNLLVLSLGSNKLLEVTRTGQILSSFDLNSVAIHNAIEGVTVDEKGNIILVAEQVQDDFNNDQHSYMYVLSAPAVPEPETYAMLMGGLGLVGFMARRKTRQG